MIVFDASSLVGAALKSDSIPERALNHAAAAGQIGLSQPVWNEITSVLSRPKLALRIPPARREALLNLVLSAAEWFEPLIPVRDCRDPNDNIYLELALAAAAAVIVTSDADLQVLSPWRGISILSPAAYLLAA